MSQNSVLSQFERGEKHEEIHGKRPLGMAREGRGKPLLRLLTMSNRPSKIQSLALAFSGLAGPCYHQFRLAMLGDSGYWIPPKTG